MKKENIPFLKWDGVLSSSTTIITTIITFYCYYNIQPFCCCYCYYYYYYCHYTATTLTLTPHPPQSSNEFHLPITRRQRWDSQFTPVTQKSESCQSLRSCMGTLHCAPLNWTVGIKSCKTAMDLLFFYPGCKLEI